MRLWLRIVAFAAFTGIAGAVLDAITGLRSEGMSVWASGVILGFGVLIGLSIFAISGWDLGFLERGFSWRAGRRRRQ